MDGYDVKSRGSVRSASITEVEAAASVNGKEPESPAKILVIERGGDLA
jgi:hypothetical protein